jgi:hypothetical protein
MGGPAAPGGEALCAGHHRAAGDQLDDQAEGLEHAPGALHGRQRHPHQLDEAGVGGPAVAAGAVLGEVGHAASDGDHGVGIDVVCAAQVPTFGEGTANLDVDPVRRAPPRRQAGHRARSRLDAGRDAT